MHWSLDGGFHKQCCEQRLDPVYFTSFFGGEPDCLVLVPLKSPVCHRPHIVPSFVVPELDCESLFCYFSHPPRIRLNVITRSHHCQPKKNLLFLKVV